MVTESNQSEEVTQEQVSEETASQETEIQTQEQSEQPTLSEERIQQLIAEETKKAVEQGREQGRREMQSVKDREVSEAQRQARFAESRAKAYEASFEGLDEDTKQTFENARLRNENQYYRTAEQNAEAERQRATYGQRLVSSIEDSIRSFGVDPSDSRIDWAPNEKDPLVARMMIDASVAKILKDDETKRQKDFENNQKKSFDEMERKLRVELGLESHDTTVSPSSGGGDEAFIQGMTDGTLPMTKENQERFNKLRGG